MNRLAEIKAQFAIIGPLMKPERAWPNILWLITEIEKVNRNREINELLKEALGRTTEAYLPGAKHYTYSHAAIRAQVDTMEKVKELENE